MLTAKESMDEITLDIECFRQDLNLHLLRDAVALSVGLRKQKSEQFRPGLANRVAPTIRDMSGQFGAGLRYWFIFQTATIH